MTFNLKDLIIVGGIPRSGTTLVQNILDSHPQIIGGPEFSYLSNIIQLYRKLLLSIESGQTAFYMTKNLVDKQISGLIKSLLLELNSENESKYISEKTPWNILIFEDLIKLLPNAKFIYAKRHPYDVIKSLFQVKERAESKNKIAPDFTTDIQKACFYIEAVYNLMKSLDEKYPGKIYKIKYEELLQDPASVTKELCTYLNIEWHSNMLKPGEFQHPGESATVNQVWYSKDDYQRNIDVSKKNNVTGRLSSLDKRFIDMVFEESNYSKDYKYEFNKDPVSLIESFRAEKLYKEYKKNFNPQEIPIRVL